MRQWFYEIQCYRQGHDNDYTYYIQSDKKLNDEAVINKLMTESIGVNGLELHHVQNIVNIIPISAEDFTEGSGIEVDTPGQNSRFEDAMLAIRDHGWKFDESTSGRKILTPPDGDPRRGWTAMWDVNGFPHWLPAFSTNGNKDTIKPITVNVTFETDGNIKEEELKTQVNQILQYHRDNIGFDFEDDEAFIEGIIVTIDDSN